MNTAPLLLIEDLPEGTVLSEASQIISVSPEASLALLQRGIPYTILEDYYAEKDLLKFDDAYFLGQIQWMDQLQDYLARKIPMVEEKGFKLIRSQYYHVKYVLDSFVSAAFIFQSLIEKLNPKTIEYVSCRDLEKEPLTQRIYALEVNDRRYEWPVLNKICRERGISIRRTVLKISQGETLRPAVGKEARASGVLRQNLTAIYDWVRYPKAARLFSRQTDYKRLSCLFLHAYKRDVGQTLKSLIRRGSRVFLKKGAAVFEVSHFLSRKVLDMEPAIADLRFQLQPAFTAAADGLGAQEFFWDGFKTRAGVDLRDLLIPCLAQFISETCCEAAAEALLLRDFCVREKINYVIARSATEQISLSALLAADSIQKTVKVCFQHGADSRISKVLLKSESDPFDIYFTIDSDSRRFMEASQKEAYLKPCRVFEYADFLRTFRKPQTVNPNPIETIMHIAARPNVSVRMLNNMEYSANRYFHLQMRLLDFYGAQTQRTFIWKYVPRISDWIYGSTLRYIESRGFKNIRLESRPLQECYDLADRFVIDFPGTAMYEIASAGVPFVVLCPDYVKNRPESLQVFGKTLRTFSMPEDALEILEDFFISAPEQYKITLPQKPEDPAEKLLSLFLTGVSNQFLFSHD